MNTAQNPYLGLAIAPQSDTGYSDGVKKAAYILRGLGIVTVIAVLIFLFWIFPNIRRQSQDMSVGNFQVAAAAASFFGENPERVFVQFDELVGPAAYIKALISVTGEDYHEMFPLRRDYTTLAVTMGEGHKVIVFFSPAPVNGRNRFLLRQMPDGKLMDINSGGLSGGVEPYRRWLEAERKPDGLYVKTLPDGRRFETTYRGGVPDGAFRAYYTEGQLWAEATYRHGRPTGPHVIYDQNGKQIYKTSIADRP